MSIFSFKKKETIPVSKNFNRGRQIKTFEEVIWLAEHGQSFYKKEWGIKPCKVLIYMTFMSVVTMLDRGELFTVVKAKNIK